MLEFLEVSKSYNEIHYAVEPMSLALDEGEFLVIVGASGSGKSTLLRMSNGLVTPSSGEVRVDGIPLCEHDLVSLRHSMGYVIQSGGLFPHLPVWENVTLVGRLYNIKKAERIKRASAMLKLTSLNPDEYLYRFPDELSGGEKQRVGVARALSQRPKILLMDEPFGALDAITREQLQGELCELHRRMGLTILFITHDIFEALELADRIAVMNEGKMLQIGTPAELLHNPKPGFVRSLFEKPATLLASFDRSGDQGG